MALKSADWSSRASAMDAWHSPGSSQTYVTPVPGDLTTSQTHTCSKTPMHKKKYIYIYMNH